MADVILIVPVTVISYSSVCTVCTICLTPLSLSDLHDLIHIHGAQSGDQLLPHSRIIMARPRALSGADTPKEPHAVSLKGTPTQARAGVTC